MKARSFKSLHQMFSKACKKKSCKAHNSYGNVEIFHEQMNSFGKKCALTGLSEAGRETTIMQKG